MEQFFIMLVGYSQSGKSTLARKILNFYPDNLIRIDSSTIHQFLNKNYLVFKDDNTIDGKSYELRQKVTKKVQNALFEILLSEGFSIILDSCNLSPEKRKLVIQKVKTQNPKIISIIIHNQTPENQLYKNLRKADQKIIKKGEKPAWIDLYEKIQKPAFKEPTQEEADFLLNYTRNTEKEFFKNFTKLVQQISYDQVKP